MKKVIIIPIFNCENYIGKAFKEYKKLKKFHDIFIVYINDGSNDSSFKIIKSLEEQYDWIKVINKENGGPASARNAGIKWVSTHKKLYSNFSFVDGDDIIIAKNYSRVLESVKKAPNNLFFSAFIRETEDLFKKVKHIENRKHDLLFSPAMCAKIFPIHFLEKCLSDEKLEGIKYEDGPMMHEINIKNKKIIKFVNFPIVIYSENMNSITRSKDPKYLRDVFVSLDNTYKRLESKNISVNMQVAFIFLEELGNHIHRSASNKNFKFKEEMDFSIKYLQQKFARKTIRKTIRKMSWLKQIMWLLIILKQTKIVHFVLKRK